MNYYEHHLGDWAQATAHLTMLETGAYQRLVQWYYAEERPLPADERAIIRIARAASDEERRAVRTVLEDFFELREDGYHQHRCDREIERYRAKREKARGSANMRWQSGRNANASSSDANASLRDADAMLSRRQTPDASHQTPVRKEEGDSASRSPALAHGTSSSKAKRGTRLPEGFALTAERSAYAVRQGVEPVRTFEKFVNYWQSATGANATKADWDAAWRNWCLRESEKLGPANPFLKGKHDRCRERLDREIAEAEMREGCGTLPSVGEHLTGYLESLFDEPANAPRVIEHKP